MHQPNVVWKYIVPWQCIRTWCAACKAISSVFRWLIWIRFGVWREIYYPSHIVVIGRWHRDDVYIDDRKIRWKHRRRNDINSGKAVDKTVGCNEKTCAHKLRLSELKSHTQLLVDERRNGQESIVMVPAVNLCIWFLISLAIKLGTHPSPPSPIVNAPAFMLT